MIKKSDRTTAIRALNDYFRRTFIGGRLTITAGVDALGADRLAAILQNVQAFEDFDADNDPHEEHDFGAIELHDTRYFWKIDYYDPSMIYGSEDAADPSKTVRVLTVMLAEEY